MKKYHKSDLQREMREHCKSKYDFAPYNHVYAEIHGTPMYLSETEVRWLQVKCKQEAEAGHFDEFCETHKVWNGPTKRWHEPMVWRMDGKFLTEFETGFFDVNTNLAFEIF